MKCVGLSTVDLDFGPKNKRPPWHLPRSATNDDDDDNDNDTDDDYIAVGGGNDDDNDDI